MSLEYPDVSPSRTLDGEYIYDGLLFSPEGIERVFAEFAGNVGFNSVEEGGQASDRDGLTFTAFSFARDPERGL